MDYPASGLKHEEPYDAVMIKTTHEVSWISKKLEVWSYKRLNWLFTADIL